MERGEFPLRRDFLYTESKDGFRVVEVEDEKTVHETILPEALTHLTTCLSVSAITSCGFSECKMLLEVKLHEGVRYIVDFAFAYCTLLKEVSVSEGLEAIGKSAFLGCTSLSQFCVPSTVVSIQNAAFCRCHSLHDVVISEGVREIGKSAFQYCQSLKRFRVPSSVTAIEESTFSNCTSLCDVAISEGVLEISKKAFFRCRALTRLSVPSTVWRIGNAAASGCKSLTDIELSIGLRQIGERAFAYCTWLFAVSLPPSLELVGNRCFQGCESLCGVEIPFGSSIQVSNIWFLGCVSLVNSLRPPHMDRFENSPIHKACYYASQTDAKDLLQMEFSTDEVALRDALGMTPFHIVATSSVARTDVLAVLMDKYPPYIQSLPHKYGQTMMDYLKMNRSSKAIPLIKMAVERSLMESVPKDWLDGWGTEFACKSVESVSWEGDSAARELAVQKAQDTLELYKQIELTTPLELALWKMKVDESGGRDRELDRTKCAADVLIPNVICFLFARNNY